MYLKPFLKKILPFVYLTGFVSVSSLIVLFALAPADVSSEQSGFLVDTLVTMFSWFDYVPSEAALGTISLLVRKLIGHVGMFLVDGALAYLTFHSFLSKIEVKWRLSISIVIMLVLAISSESLQFVASGRAPMVEDGILDMAGAMFGISIAYWLMIGNNKEKVI